MLTFVVEKQHGLIVAHRGGLPRHLQLAFATTAVAQEIAENQDHQRDEHHKSEAPWLHTDGAMWLIDLKY